MRNTRELLEEINILSQLDQINISDRNKNIVQDFCKDKLSQSQLAVKYNISTSRIHAILINARRKYILHKKEHL